MKPARDWYVPLAAHLRAAYLRYAFTKGTQQEADFLYDILDLAPGKRLLDVGMGPGRHSIALAQRGVEVVGIDISSDFVQLAQEGARQANVSAAFFQMDAADMVFDEEFDAVMSICEGAFSLGLDDLSILRRMGVALKTDGRLAVAAVNLFYVLTHMRDSGELDPVTMMYREEVEVIGEDGSKRIFEMFNTTYTPRELEWIANGAGLLPRAVYGVQPGEYRQREPGFDDPELLLLAEKTETDGSKNGKEY